MDKEKRLNLNIPEQLHKAIRIAAAHNNMTIKMYVISLLIDELKKSGLIKIK